MNLFLDIPCNEHVVARTDFIEMIASKDQRSSAKHLAVYYPRHMHVVAIWTAPVTSVITDMSLEKALIVE